MNFLREIGKSIEEDDNSYKFILIDKNSRMTNKHNSNNTSNTTTKPTNFNHQHHNINNNPASVIVANNPNTTPAIQSNQQYQQQQQHQQVMLNDASNLNKENAICLSNNNVKEFCTGKFTIIVHPIALKINL